MGEGSRTLTTDAVRGRFDPTLLDSLPDVFSVHDAEGRYLYVSGSMQALTGHAVDDLVGQNPYELGLVHPDDLGSIIEGQAAALASDPQPLRTQYRMRRRDGAYIWVETTSTVVTTDAGDTFVAATREASHVESLLQGIAVERRLKGQFDELIARQRRFLTTVSHRARTPLTAISGMLELLEAHGDRLDEERRGLLLTRLRANSERLVELMEEVTEADRLTRADVVLERHVVRLHDLVESVVEGQSGRDGPVHNHVDPELTAIVDRGRVTRLLTILVGNALHHGGLGTTVDVRGRATDEGVELVVEDDGPGVPVQDRQAIFEPFSHGLSDDPDPGAGLGLHIVSELVALHGGRIWVDERPGGGARFHVRLPRGAGRPGHDTGQGPSSTGAALSPEAMTVVQQLLRTLRNRVGMDVTYLSILDDDHQHVLATSGDNLAGIEAGRAFRLHETYCMRMVAEEIEHVIGDTASHPVVGELPGTADGIACWIGVPVHLPTGQVFGSLCAASGEAEPELSPSAADEFATFADILGEVLAQEGLVDRTMIDAGSRVADVLTRPDGVRVVFQPIVELETGAVSGVEALARIGDEDRPVDLWFADAARAGLLLDLEVRMVELALAELDHLDSDTYLAVNVSPRTLRSRDLAAVFESAPLHRLVLEVSEHADVDDYGPVLEALDGLRAQGVRLAIDDTGTGSAGFGHLFKLQPDILKVDRSLVPTLASDPPHRAAVEGLVGLAERIGADAVAEGVETPTTLRAVREVGFTHVQGHLLGRPVPACELGDTSGTVRVARRGG